MGSIPILQLYDCLLVSIQVEIDDQLALRLQNDLLESLHKTGAHGVILDLRAVGVVDSFLGRVITETAKMAHLMGAETVVVGIQPEVGVTLMEMGLELTGVKTALTLEYGLEGFLGRLR